VKIIAVADYAGLGIIGSMDAMRYVVVGLFGLIAWCAIFGGLGAWVAKQCGRDSFEGGMLGVLFGPFGVLVEGLLPKHPPR
jgi:hypothetical protein